MSEENQIEFTNRIAHPAEQDILRGQQRYAFAKALRRIDKSSDMPWEKESEYTYLAQDLMKAGEEKKALELVEKLDNSYYKAEFYISIAHGQTPRSPYWEKAREAALRINQSAEQVEFLVGVGLGQGRNSAAWEDIRNKLHTLENVDSSDLERAKMTTAEGLAAVGDIRAAFDMIDTFDSNVDKAECLIHIAVNYDQSAWAKAEATVMSLHPYDRGGWQQVLALSMVRKGRLNNARRVAGGIEDKELQKETLEGIEETIHKNDGKAADKKTSPIAAVDRPALHSRDVHTALQSMERSVEEAHSGEYRTLAVKIAPEAAAEAPAVLERKAARANYLGGALVEHWRDFKNLDATEFARLAHGAAEVAHAYMTDEERREFIRGLAGEFRQFRDKGMFNDGSHQAVLKHLSEAMTELEDPAATGQLLETMTKTMGEATGLRLLKTLIESGNARAGAAGISLLCNSETSDHVYNYLLHKLAQTEYIDPALPAAVLEEETGGRLPAWGSRRVIQHFYEELGVQMDSGLLKWVTKDLRFNDFDDGYYDGSPTKVATDYLENQLADISRQVENAIARFQRLDQGQLLQDLSKNENDRALYFLLYGGRTKYALIQHYNFGKFSQSVLKAEEIQQNVDLSLMDRDLWRDAPDGWLEAMANRHRPSPDLVWQAEVGASSVEMRENARRGIYSTLGLELSWLLHEGKAAHNFADFSHGEHVETLEKKLQQRHEEDIKLTWGTGIEFLFGDRTGKKVANILGPSVTSAVNGERLANVGDFEKAKSALLAQLRQLRKNSKQLNPEISDEWKAVIERAETEDPVIALRHLLSLLANDPGLSLHPQGAVNEWIGHLHGLASTIRESQVKSSEMRSLTLRYLDGKEDFAELLRFADGAQCCFTSEQTIEDGLMDATGEWRMRINRDPHWFVFSIEDTPPEAAKRASTGFIFGSLARLDGRPALALNGVYMQRKTDAAVNKILDDIAERFAKPLGINQVLIASTYGGEFSPDKSKWQPAGDRTLYRPRAIRTGVGQGELYEEYTSQQGMPETFTYDDLGRIVNQDQAVPNYCWVRVL